MTTLAIIGGGFTGAAVAYHLAQSAAGRQAKIVVVEPREVLGAGLAYSTRDPAHRINVPADRMSLDTQDPDAFARWLRATGAVADDPDAVSASGQAFPQRGLFGRYVADALAPFVASGRIVHRRTAAEAIRRLSDGTFDVVLADGSLHADLVVVATTHPPPAVPAALRALSGDPRFVVDPGEPDALDGVPPDARVLVVGSGLTAADMVASLDRRGHRGPILMLSRNGLRSRGHAPSAVEPFGDFTSTPGRTARELTRRARQAITEAKGQGISWHAVLDALRGDGAAIWGALPEAERRRVVHRLRSFWDVHRFRIAPQVADVLDRLDAAGRLRLVAASLASSRPDAGGLHVAWRPRGGRAVETGRFDVVVNTTGPAHRAVVDREPVRSLFEAGLVDLDRVGLGLRVDADHRALGRDGEIVPGLFIAGPLARGTFGELMGLPQVTAHAELVARILGEILAGDRDGSALRQAV
ncbi:FAD/NAD(P)-binding protein [uncultured Aureimonas sp.]|uniref:FAD/NAD(P)-binding protein n=1 Tax=uncultured Aureimonas sp. TaxID=1604662 RepID=UPI0025D1AA76|nr:FAD/NAD(P)-binding protein [uncultured Aureimonas sp.]